MEPITYVISQEEILGLDTQTILRRFDGSQYEPGELQALCGQIRIRVEGITRLEHIYGEQAPRRFFRQLCTQWPIGYYLRLEEITAGSDMEEVMDTGVFVAVGLCHADIVFGQWDSRGVSGMSFSTDLFERWMKRTAQHACSIGQEAGLSAEVIQLRTKLISSAVLSFFEFLVPPRHEP